MHTNEKLGKKRTPHSKLHKDSLNLTDHRGWGVTRVRSVVQDQKVGIADTESPDASDRYSMRFDAM